MDADNVEHSLIDKEKSVTIPKEETSAFIENLAPKTQYHFNLSVLFNDGTWGAPNALKIETRIEGTQSPNRMFIFIFFDQIR